MYKPARRALIYNSRHCSTTKDVKVTYRHLGTFVINEEFSIETVPVHQRHVAALTVHRSSLLLLPHLKKQGILMNDLDHLLSHEEANQQQLHTSNTFRRLGIKGE